MTILLAFAAAELLLATLAWYRAALAKATGSAA